MIDQAAAYAEARSDRRLLQALVQQMFEEHERVPSIHRRFFLLRGEAQLGGKTSDRLSAQVASGIVARVCNFNRRFCAISRRR